MPLSAMSGCITHESFYFLVSLHMHFFVFASCWMGPNHFRQPIQPCYHKKQDQIPHTFRSHALFLWDSRLVTLSFPFTLAGLCRTIEWVTETVVALFLHVYFPSLLFDQTRPIWPVHCLPLPTFVPVHLLSICHWTKLYCWSLLHIVASLTGTMHGPARTVNWHVHVNSLHRLFVTIMTPSKKKFLDGYSVLSKVKTCDQGPKVST